MPSEKVIFSKEYFSGLYGIGSYYFSKLLVELPMFIFLPIIQLAIVYFIAGYKETAEAFWLLG